MDSAVGVGDAGVADSEGLIGDTWWFACLVVVCSRGCGVVGVGAGRGLRLGGWWFWAFHSLQVVGWLVASVVLVVSGVGVVPPAVFRSVVVGVAPVVVEGVDAVGGWVAVLLCCPCQWCW